ncbi:hypothetical protein GGR54DRAFT_644472 [Hypoxylon sp. NC1633]|nr:hypothetical protein GGR54DRAFT_644472 [Hypoxylon sp. NC1633]
MASNGNGQDGHSRNDGVPRNETPVGGYQVNDMATLYLPADFDIEANSAFIDKNGNLQVPNTYLENLRSQIPEQAYSQGPRSQVPRLLDPTVTSPSTPTDQGRPDAVLPPSPGLILAAIIHNYRGSENIIKSCLAGAWDAKRTVLQALKDPAVRNEVENTWGRSEVRRILHAEYGFDDALNPISNEQAAEVSAAFHGVTDKTEMAKTETAKPKTVNPKTAKTKTAKTKTGRIKIRIIKTGNTKTGNTKTGNTSMGFTEDAE